MFEIVLLQERVGLFDAHLSEDLGWLATTYPLGGGLSRLSGSEQIQTGAFWASFKNETINDLSVSY